MPDYPEFAEVVVAVLTPFATALTEKRAEEVRPFFHVKRIGGGEDPDEITDTAIIRVEIFANSYAQAQLLKRQSRAVARLTNTMVGSVCIDTAREITASQERPGQTQDDRQQTATFELSARAQ